MLAAFPVQVLKLQGMLRVERFVSLLRSIVSDVDRLHEFELYEQHPGTRCARA